MTTLGFGDITFTSDVGRLFSIVVLLSGVVLLLVMLPFMFIRLFYAPWLEARVRLRAPREVPAGHARPRDPRRVRSRSPAAWSSGCAPSISRTSSSSRIRTVAARMIGDGISVIAGENDNRATYRRSTRSVRGCCSPTAKTRPTPTSPLPCARSRPSSRSRRSSRRRTRSTCSS